MTSHLPFFVSRKNTVGPGFTLTPAISPPPVLPQWKLTILAPLGNAASSDSEVQLAPELVGLDVDVDVDLVSVGDGDAELDELELLEQAPSAATMAVVPTATATPRPIRLFTRTIPPCSTPRGPWPTPNGSSRDMSTPSTPVRSSWHAEDVARRASLASNGRLSPAAEAQRRRGLDPSFATSAAAS